jgi:hypothetical protein
MSNEIQLHNGEEWLPSLEQIQKMEMKRSQAIESLEIFDHSIKCQRCGIAVPIVEGTKSRANAKRIISLQIRIKQLEMYKHNNNRNEEEIKVKKQELADLEAVGDTKMDKIRNSSLCSCAATRFQWVCGECFDKCEKAYQRSLSRKNKKKLIERHVNV